MQRFDAVVIGAGAAGMMCAIEAGARGRRVLVVDHAKAPGEKIRISGGGRCNFTHLDASPANFISDNPGFCTSALRRYRPTDFVALLDQAGIAWHEKTPGQLFCDGSARQVVDLLTSRMAENGVDLRLGQSVTDIQPADGGYRLSVGGQAVESQSLVIATGGKSIPKMGATAFGYEVAARFGHRIVETRPGLVPLTFETGLLQRLAPLAGVALPVRATSSRAAFEDAMLFTHRGISGPAILQISSYWREGEPITLDMAPGIDLFALLKAAKQAQGRQSPAAALSRLLPARLAELLALQQAMGPRLADAPDAAVKGLAQAVQAWTVKPVGSEGYRTAEVTLGGVDTRELDQRTLESRRAPGLYFIGEVVDVTGWLGGYNFQWAWASGWCAGQTV